MGVMLNTQGSPRGGEDQFHLAMHRIVGGIATFGSVEGDGGNALVHREGQVLVVAVVGHCAGPSCLLAGWMCSPRPARTGLGAEFSTEEPPGEDELLDLRRAVADLPSDDIA